MEEIRWYVVGSPTRGQELKIRDELRRESLDCFVPLRYEVKAVKDHRQRLMVPAVPGFVFLKGTLDQLQEAIRFRKHHLFLRKSTFTNGEDYLTVSDHDMQNFIAFSEKAGEKITYYDPSEIQLRPGDKIRVNGGLYDGREGVIMRVKGKRRKQLVVSIPGILIASVEMEPDLIELTSTSTPAPVRESEGPSKNVEEDKRLLMRLAKRLLFEIPTSSQNEKEYYLLLSELKRTSRRLSPIRAFLSAQEVELALPLYLTAVKLQQDVERAEQRLRAAVAKLQDTSLLKVRAQMYLAFLASDEALFQQVAGKVEAMKSHKLSVNQRCMLEEYELVSHSITQKT